VRKRVKLESSRVTIDQEKRSVHIPDLPNRVA
jgi:hypothetical protein